LIDSRSLLAEYLALSQECYAWQPGFVNDMINYYRGMVRTDEMPARIDKFDLSFRKRRLLSIYDFLNSSHIWPAKLQLSQLVLDPGYPDQGSCGADNQSSVLGRLVDLDGNLSVLANLGFISYQHKKEMRPPDLDVIYYELSTASELGRHDLMVMLHMFTSTVLFHADQSRIAWSMFCGQKREDPNSLIAPDKDPVLS